VCVRARAQMAAEESDKPYYHLCIVNLVIGTLYCAKVCVLPVVAASPVLNHIHRFECV
jgi:hypothetical protein